MTQIGADQPARSARPAAGRATAAEARRRRIDQALAAYVAFPSGCPGPLQEAIRYGLLGPGKRLRPQLVLMAAEACGGSVDATLPVACAVEMVHAYSLIHDDLPAMDDDDVRRGRPTCHKVFGEALAILAGDALLARAFEIVATAVTPPETAARCVAELARAAGASALVGGQADDLAWDPDRQSVEMLEDIHQRKTGALFRASLRLGGLLAGAGAEELQALETCGTSLGLAFQITDDLLDKDDDDDGAADPAADGNRALRFPDVVGKVQSRRRAAELVEEACAALAFFGPRAAELVGLAQSIPDRMH